MDKKKQRVERTRNNKQWTEARYRQFITTALRRASMRWGPINAVKRNARVKRNTYKCNVCGGLFPNKDVVVDHIKPAVDPIKGFESWDIFIERLLCEEDNLQLICKECHSTKSDKERKLRQYGKSKV